MVVEVPPVKTNKLDKKRFHTAKLLLQKTLGRKLTNQQFNDYLKIRAESLRKKREEIATYGPEGKPEEKPLSEAPAEVKIDQAIKDALK